MSKESQATRLPKRIAPFSVMDAFRVMKATLRRPLVIRFEKIKLDIRIERKNFSKAIMHPLNVCSEKTYSETTEKLMI